VQIQRFPDPLGLRTSNPDSIFQLMLRLQYNFG